MMEAARARIEKLLAEDRAVGGKQKELRAELARMRREFNEQYGTKGTPEQMMRDLERILAQVQGGDEERKAA